MKWEVKSPNKDHTLLFYVDEQGRPTYQLNTLDTVMVKPLTLGIELKDLESLVKGFSVLDASINSIREEWKPVYGERSLVCNLFFGMTNRVMAKESLN